VIHSFGDKDLEQFFISGKRPHKFGWTQVSTIVKRKLDMLDYASELLDLKSPPNNCLEKLKGDLEGFYSIRVNAQMAMDLWTTDRVKRKISSLIHHRKVA
jgi:toxin HigB-1